MIAVVMLQLGLASVTVTGSPCELDDVTSLAPQLTSQKDVTILLGCDEGISTLEVRRVGSEPVLRRFRLDGETTAAREALLVVLVDEALAVDRPLTPPEMPRRFALVAAPMVQVGLPLSASFGGTLEFRAALLPRLSLVAAVSGATGTLTVDDDRLTWQPWSVSVGVVATRATRLISARAGVVATIGLLSGQGASNTDAEVQQAVLWWWGPAAVIGGALHFDPWFLDATVGAGLAIRGATISIQLDDRPTATAGIARGWLWGTLGVGLRF